MGIHDGHRQRMRDQALKQGLDGFPDHSVMELILFMAVPRGDVNPLAHRLIDKFGTVAGVLDAPVSELLKVEGVGGSTAAVLKLLPQLCRRYMISRAEINDIILTPRNAGAYLKPRFLGESDEVVYIACLDGKCKVTGCVMVGRGSVNSAGVSIRKVVQAALNMEATAAILAHNHTSGIALPSKEDEIATEKVRQALEAVDIRLIDHIIVADDDFVSMAENGFFTEGRPLRGRYVLE